MIPTSLSFQGGSARSDASATQTQDANTTLGATGNRGFQNNVAFSGSTQNNAQGINDPISPKSIASYAAIGGVLLVLGLAIWRKVR